MKTQTEILPRVTFTDDLLSPVEAEREELARQAAKVLGYRKMAQVLVVPDALAFTLRKLEIAPLVTSSVHEYKRKKEKTGIWSCRRKAVLPLLFLPFAAVATFWAWQHASRSLDVPGYLPWIGWFLVTIALVITSIMLAVEGGSKLFTSSGRGTRKIHTWNRVPIGSYNGNIPEFALHKAVRIQSALPKAKLSIDQLMVEEEVDKRESKSNVIEALKDPFLFVELGTESYYIDVWDEKEYERKM